MALLRYRNIVLIMAIWRAFFAAISGNCFRCNSQYKWMKWVERIRCRDYSFASLILIHWICFGHFFSKPKSIDITTTAHSNENAFVDIRLWQTIYRTFGFQTHKNTQQNHSKVIKCYENNLKRMIFKKWWVPWHTDRTPLQTYVQINIDNTMWNNSIPKNIHHSEYRYRHINNHFNIVA